MFKNILIKESYFDTSIQVLRKLELKDLYLESLLLECELDEIKTLSDFFYVLNKAEALSSTPKDDCHLLKTSLTTTSATESKLLAYIEEKIKANLNKNDDFDLKAKKKEKKQQQKQAKIKEEKQNNKQIKNSNNNHLLLNYKYGLYSFVKL